MEHTEETLNIVCVIEEASKLSIYEIIDESIEPWVTLYNEEVERMENENVEF